MQLIRGKYWHECEQKERRFRLDNTYRAIQLILTPQEFVKYCLGEPGLFAVDCSRMPADAKVDRVWYDPKRNQIHLVLTTVEGDWPEHSPNQEVDEIGPPPVISVDLDRADDLELRAVLADELLGPQLLRLVDRVNDLHARESENDGE